MKNSPKSFARQTESAYAGGVGPEPSREQFGTTEKTYEGKNIYNKLIERLACQFFRPDFLVALSSFSTFPFKIPKFIGEPRNFAADHPNI